MSAVFPASIKTFVDKVDYRDTVLAEHINSLQDEVTSVERSLGTSLLTSSGYNGTFDSTTTSWDPYQGGLSARIQNIEYGVRGDAHTQYIRKGAQADNVITPGSPSTVALTLSPASGQTADLLSANGASISKDGVVFSGMRRVATVDGPETLTNKTISGTQNTLTDIPASEVLISPGVGILDYVYGRPQFFAQPEMPTGPDIPLGSVWVDTDGQIESLADIKAELKAIVAAAADFTALKTAIAAW